MGIFKEIAGQGEDVVILHGWGWTHQHMQPLVEELSKHYRVTNIDLPGRGQSDWYPTIKTIHDIADVLLPHLPKQAIYIGWSFGGLVPISIAARYPQYIKRFVGIATTPKFLADKDWPGVPVSGFKTSFAKLKQSGVKDFFAELYNFEFSTLDSKSAAYQKLIQLTENSEIDLNVFLKGLDICDITDLRTEFETLRCPVDLIFSSKDYVVPSAVHKKIKSLNPKVNIHTIDDAQHIPFWTHPNEFNKILKSILL